MPEEETMGEDEPDESIQPQEEEHLKEAEFIDLEEEIKKKISKEVDPITKANMNGNSEYYTVPTCSSSNMGMHTTTIISPHSHCHY